MAARPLGSATESSGKIHPTIERQERNSTLYSTSAVAVGGRSGKIRSDDGLLDLQLALPKELGSKGGAANPEQLFAAGYAACFENAVIHVSRSMETKVRDQDIEVKVTVGMSPNGKGGFALSVIATPEKAGFGYTLKQPIGPVGLITPWNFPTLAAAWKVSAALAAGCTAVLKPSEETPFSSLRFAELLLEAGLPAGVVNVVTGDGRTGAAIVSHPDLKKISFTGSVVTGRKIVEAAAHDLRRVTLELGGKSPLVICTDADIDRAVQMAAAVMWGNSGQVCAAGSRLFIARPIFDEVLERVAAIVRAIKPGDPTDPKTMMGPLVSAKQLGRVVEMVESGRAAGARVVIGGERIDGEGFFFPPTLFADVDPTMRIMREEIFGPVVCASPFDDLDSIMPQLNDSDYGLAAYIWTRDIRTAHRFAQDIEAGAVFVNSFGGFHYALPFGGFKQSGWGREHAEEGLNAFLEVKKVTFDMS